MDWLRNLVTGGLHAVADALRRVQNWLIDFWNSLAAIFTRWANALAHVKDQAAYAAVMAVRFVQAVLGTLSWLVLTKIPHEISVLAGTIQRWATAAINSAVAIINQAIGAVRSFALSIVNAAKTLILDIVNTVIAALNKAIALLSDVAKRVYALLVDPSAMAEWVAGALLAPVGRYIVAHAEAYARLLLATGVGLIMRAAPTIESIITDIF